MAVHRLRKDGWIESERDGRESLYRLTAMGRAERDRAALRIHDRTMPTHAGATPVIAPPDSAEALAKLVAGGAITLAPRTVLSEHPPVDPDMKFLCLRLNRGTVPDWVRSLLADDMLCAEFNRLSTCVDRIVQAPRSSDTLKRTVLPDDWPGAKARAQVMTLLDELPALALKALAATAHDQTRKT